MRTMLIIINVARETRHVVGYMYAERKTNERTDDEQRRQSV